MPTLCRGTALACALAVAVVYFSARSAEVVLKDGRILKGKVGEAVGLAEKPQLKRAVAGAPVPSLVVLVDDGLRRLFVPKRQVVEVRPGTDGEVLEKFTITQSVRRSGQQVHNVAAIARIEPFDEFGRRTFTMQTDKGPMAIFQGITEITPRWTKVEGLNYVWDMRVATSSIPRETLDKVLRSVINERNVEQRLQRARLYLQSERYPDAALELQGILNDFPEVRPQIEPQLKSLSELSAKRLLTEIRLRALSGQHQLVGSLLEKFPSENVSGETLQAVRAMLDEQKQQHKKGQADLRRIDELLAAVSDSDLRQRLKPMRDEISAEISFNTLPRMAAFERLQDDTTLEPAQKLALAASGWVGGAAGATEDIAVALSVWELRNLVAEYLVESQAARRKHMLDDILGRYGATPELIARIVNYMKPPFPLPEPLPDVPGHYELPLRLIDPEPDSRYLLQLPPEYDPHLRYPAIVTLHGGFTTPEQQIEWWAGPAAPEGEARLGQAARHGYIVIAPAWGKAGQLDYDYSARSHAAVLNALRDANRRFSIDTDRVFISGHSLGGDAAWDIAWAHPDLWAGAIPITASSKRFCDFYWENGRYVPLYVVGGELDGDKTVRNAKNLDRCFIKGYNVTVAEYLGRGHEHFSDEIHDLFGWMGRCRRDFFPKEFACDTLRPWDNFFWWVEVADLPPRAMVDPAAWPPPRGTRATRVAGTISAANTVRVNTGAQRVTVWLSPETIDFGRKLVVTVNGSRVPKSEAMSPDVEVLLEDVRTRGDRQHPFWARVDVP